MALIPVQDPQTGKLYNVQIAGDTPTQQEITEIKEWLASQSQPVETTTPIAETTPAEEPGFFESTAGAGFPRTPPALRSSRVFFSFCNIRRCTLRSVSR